MRAALLALTLAACRDGGAAPVDAAGTPDLALACPDDLPERCPSPAPSWDVTAAPIVAARCTPCHGAGGQAATLPLGTYAEVYARRGAVLNQVYACTMPPPDAGTLTPTERAGLLGWLVCGAPD